MAKAETKSERSEENVRIVTITLAFPETDISRYEGKICPDCKAPLRASKVEHKNQWGDQESLVVAFPETPALICECKDGLFQPYRIDPVIGEMISERCHLIREYFEFPDEEGLTTLEGTLSSEDLLKLIDFTIALRKERSFQRGNKFPEGTVHLEKAKEKYSGAGN